VFEMTVEFNMNTAIVNREAILAQRQFALDTQVLQDCQTYCPEADGTLKASGVTFSRPGQGFVGYNTPYAKRLYYNPQFNFSKDKNPNARGKWFEEAKARNLPKWLEIAGDV
jgi:hypothetical protein